MDGGDHHGRHPLLPGMVRERGAQLGSEGQALCMSMGGGEQAATSVLRSRVMEGGEQAAASVTGCSNSLWLWHHGRQCIRQAP